MLDRVQDMSKSERPLLMESGLIDGVWRARFAGADYDIVRHDLKEARDQIQRLQKDRIQRLQQEVVNLWSAVNQRPATVLRYGDLNEPA